jgi:formiminoglutamase
MIVISDYFQALNFSSIGIDLSECEDSFGASMLLHTKENGFPDLEGAQIAIIGVKEDRASVNNKGCADAVDLVRNKLYKLKAGIKVNVVDLGNINPGHSVNDTYFAVSDVCATLIKQNIIPLIIGGSQDLTFAQYRAYESLEQTINMVSVDSSFDLGRSDGEDELTSQSYLGKIIIHQPNYLFNYSNIGYQTYFANKQTIELMDKLYFDAYRLGQVRQDLEEVEPVVRNADMLTFDISAIRQSDAPANGNPSPHGFYGEEACQIVRYAGMSDKLSSIGFYELNPAFDRDAQTVHLLAHMIWYFIEGYGSRKKDYPLTDKKDFLKYRVAVKESEQEIVFYKSNKSDRWWMEVPYLNNKSKYERHHLLPCSYSDYQIACNEVTPERWWQTFQKLS